MKKTTIFPLLGYVLIEPIEEEQVSSGGIALPETDSDKPMKGKIVDVGKMPKDGDLNLYDELARAKTVVYKKWTNQEVEHKGKKYLLVKFDELLGIIE